MVLPYIYFRDSTTIFPFCWLWYRGNSVTGVVYIRYTCAHGTHNGPFTRKKWIMFETVIDIDSFIPWLLLIKMIPKPDHVQNEAIISVNPAAQMWCWVYGMAVLTNDIW